VYGLKEIILHDVKSRTDMVGPQVANEPDGAGVQGRRTHVLPLARARLPLGYLSYILEPRLEHIHGAAQGWALTRLLNNNLELLHTL
jgi:hypothetical protein